MKPHIVSKKVHEALIGYMKKYRPVEVHDPKLGEELRGYFNSKVGSFVSDCYVERQPYYVSNEETKLSALQAEGLITEQTSKLFAAYFGAKSPDEWSLYVHQKQAIEDMNVRDEEPHNLLVCTGTGSGKTESFLIPMIDALIRERRQCEESGQRYEKGVRAMILYPMNALVDDQLRRIRHLFMEAEKLDIKYAKDVTFGIYTGDVKTLAAEKAPYMLNVDIDKAIIDAQKEADEIEQGRAVDEKCAHPYLSVESVPRNEYSRRSDWLDEADGGKGPADILITNYSMLERLLIDPGMCNLFSATWRFIVLDEAHTYNGAQGTEISWLIRRLRQRLTTGDRKAKLSYMATSATLVDDPVNFEEESVKFAQKLFSTEGEFHPREGTLLKDVWHEPEGGDRDPEQSYGALDVLPGAAKIGELQSSCGFVGEGGTLVEQSNWYLQALSWVKEIRSARSGMDRLLNKSECALGDAIALLDSFSRMPHAIANSALFGECPDLLSSVSEEEEEDDEEYNDEEDFLEYDEEDIDVVDENSFGLHLELPSGVVELLGLIERKDKSFLDEFLRKSVDEHEIEEYKDFFDKIRCADIECGKVFVTLKKLEEAELLGDALSTFAEDLRMPDTLGSELNPLTWRVSWQKAEIERMATELARFDEEGDIGQALNSIGEQLNKAWYFNLFHKEIDPNDAPSFRKSISRYLLSRPHLAQFAKYLEDCASKPELLTTDAISAKLFNTSNHEDKLKEFSAFTSIIGLSEYSDKVSNKPLMDLRYHQVVAPPAEVYLYFTVNEKGEAQVHIPHIADTGVTEYMDEEGKSHRLYRLGFCHDCGQPYILGYMGENTGDEFNSKGTRNFGSTPNSKRKEPAEDCQILHRYRSRKASFLQAFSWIKGEHGDSLEEEEPLSFPSRYPCWLDFDSGEVHWCKENPATNSNDGKKYIRLEYYAYTEDIKSKKKDEEKNTSPEFIATCPACHASKNSDGGDFGIINPFRLGTNAARVAVLNALVSEADRSFTPNPTPSGERKVLTFSDSRSAAAYLAMEFDRFGEQSLLLAVIKQVLWEVYGNDKPEKKTIMSELRDFMNDAEKGKKLLPNTSKEAKPNSPVYKYLKHGDDSLCEKAFKRLQGNLLLLIPGILEKLNKAGSDSLLRREYGDEMFNQGDSAVLSVLKVLRTCGPRWNDIYKYSELSSAALRRVKNIIKRDKQKKVKSKDKSTNAWEKFVGLFVDCKTAERYFCMVYNYLFMHIKLDCESFSDVGCDYELEKDYAVNGYSFGDKKFVYQNAPDGNVNNKKEVFIFVNRESANSKIRTLLSKNFSNEELKLENDESKDMLTPEFETQQ